MSDRLPNGICRHNLTIKASNLNGILCAAQAILLKLGYMQPDGSRNKELDQVSAIVSVSVDLSKKLLGLVDKIGPMPSGH